ncbi:MAG TPA: C45 family autoproteolytic acyltransferase/hydrolase [Lacipirellulaceae bacterium]|nr:C45 family autoproteolytic acyltransferase/hydrolase [Lacipirellulaceae bacterium]
MGLVLALAAVVAATAAPVAGETVARHGQGWLEVIDGYPVLHLKGTPFEMGEQHGVLLRDHVRECLQFVLQEKADANLVAAGPLKLTPRMVLESIIAIQRPHVPDRYWEEMRGLAQGAGVDLTDLHAANFIPELFHCSGFAVMNDATADGTLYHGRVLDYGVDLRLQDHAVLIVAEPDGGVPYVNVGYAGFIGSVTGMNAEQISIGEMGGGGLGHWDGVPMALLVRQVIESARDLDQALAVFRDQPRTCEYFFVIADGKTNEAVAIEASWNRFSVIRPGQADTRLPRPVKDAVLLSAGTRYDRLVDRVEAQHGQLTAETALRLMDRPVAMRSNLHNVLFEPRSTRLWVANASSSGEPAAQQRYHAFQLSELLSRTPQESVAP